MLKLNSNLIKKFTCGSLPFHQIFGLLSDHDMLSIYQTSADQFLNGQDGWVVNLGVFQGKSLGILSEVFGSERVVGIDNWCMGGLSHELATENLQKAGYNPTIVSGDTRDVPEWIDKVSTLFIDSDHSAQHLRGEYEAWLPHLNSDALVVLHDYSKDMPNLGHVYPWPIEMLIEYVRQIEILFDQNDEWRRVDHRSLTVAYKRNVR